jgi:hypothetical protein
MSTLTDASGYVQQIAGPYGSRKERISRAHNRIVCAKPAVGFSWNRVKDLFDAEQRCRVAADELAELQKIAKTQRLVDEANNGYAELLERVARLEAMLLRQDENFHRNQVDCIREAAVGTTDEAGRVDRAMDQSLT